MLETASWNKELIASALEDPDGKHMLQVLLLIQVKGKQVLCQAVSTTRNWMPGVSIHCAVLEPIHQQLLSRYHLPSHQLVITLFLWHRSLGTMVMGTLFS
jgi:hypothetical protein